MTGARWQNLLLLAGGLLASAFFLFPPFWALISSFMPPDRVGRIAGFRVASFENYRQVFAQQAFWKSLQNSAMASLGATVASTLLAIPAAYGLTRFRLELKGLALAILGVRMVPGILLVLPFYLMFRQLHLLDTVFGLCLTYLTFTLPFSIWMIASFFEAIPHDIEEAAALDGASRWTICWRIVTPIAAPAILTTAVLNFIFCWNDFLFALIVTSQDALTFLPLLLRYVLPQGPLYGQIFGVLDLHPAAVDCPGPDPQAPVCGLRPGYSEMIASSRQQPGSMTVNIDAHIHLWRLARGDNVSLSPGDAADLARVSSRRTCGPASMRQASTASSPCRRREDAGRSALPDRPRPQISVDRGRRRLGRAGASPAIEEEVAALAWNPGGEGRPADPRRQPVGSPISSMRAWSAAGWRAGRSTGCRSTSWCRTGARFSSRQNWRGGLPYLNIILDHCGKPDIAGGHFEPWATDLKAFAQLPNVSCKLSGLMNCAAPGAGVEAVRPYAEHVLGAFGPSRVLWASDWPPCPAIVGKGTRACPSSRWPGGGHWPASPARGGGGRRFENRSKVPRPSLDVRRDGHRP